MSTIGKRIKEKRLELGWTLREFSEKLGYKNHSTVARIESGKIDIAQSKIANFSKVLGVSISYLMGWDEKAEEKPLSEGEKRLLELFRQIPEEKQKLVLEMIKVALSSK